MAKDCLPYFRFYHDDFFGDEKVEYLTNEQIGIYLRLMRHQWKNGSIPSSLGEIEILCKLKPGQVFSDIWPGLDRCFSASSEDPARLQNTRLERERKDLEEYRDKCLRGGKKGASKRWAGELNSLPMATLFSPEDKTAQTAGAKATEILKAFGELHKKKFGKIYQASFQKDTTVVKEIVRLQGEQDTLLLLTIFFGENWDNSFLDKAGYTIGTFKASIPKMLRRLIEVKRRAKEIAAMKQREDEARARAHAEAEAHRKKLEKETPGEIKKLCAESLREGERDG